MEGADIWCGYRVCREGIHGVNKAGVHGGCGYRVGMAGVPR